MSDEIKRVYQGGHHDVWCDGESHVKCGGGFTRADRDTPDLTGPVSRYRCDCAKWADGKNGWAA